MHDVSRRRTDSRHSSRGRCVSRETHTVDAFLADSQAPASSTCAACIRGGRDRNVDVCTRLDTVGVNHHSRSGAASFRRNLARMSCKLTRQTDGRCSAVQVGRCIKHTSGVSKQSRTPQCQELTVASATSDRPQQNQQEVSADQDISSQQQLSSRVQALEAASRRMERKIDQILQYCRVMAQSMAPVS